jgi:hypothetical protein
MIEGIFWLIATIIIVVTLFAVGRDFILWYFKINERVNLQKEQVRNQQRIIQLLEQALLPQEQQVNRIRAIAERYDLR